MLQLFRTLHNCRILPQHVASLYSQVWCRVQRGRTAVNYRHETRTLLSALRRRKREIRARLKGRRVHWVVR